VAATDTTIGRPAASVPLTARIPRPRWSGEAWTAIAVTAVFVAITCWWLSQDGRIPQFDAGRHLRWAVSGYELLSAGSVGKALTVSLPYPPFAYLVGALGLWIGGIDIAPPIIAENTVFVPLLALGCYQVGRLAFGRRAGLLAVVFALGSPLIIAQFHVFMVDAPETAMAAVSVWLILATERFSRVWVSAAAGVAVGLGMLTKEPLAFFVAGVVLVTAIRGGRRAWRGLAVFAAVALSIALPWYVNDFSQVHSLAQSVTSPRATEPPNGISPPRFSGRNLMWYFWNIAKVQLYAPLFALAIVGGAWTIAGFLRRRPVSPLAWELTVGAFVAWLGITNTFVHDMRYSMPLLVYLAVFGSGWIARLPRARRLFAAGALVVVAIANTLSTNFGVGREVSVTLPGARPQLLATPGVLVLYSNAGFVVAQPESDGDVLGLMRALRRHGVRYVTWTDLSNKEPSTVFNPVFSNEGLAALAQIAKLQFFGGLVLSQHLTAHDAILGQGPIERGEAPPCLKLRFGKGVWVRLGDYNARGAKDYCPYRHPAFYGA
jgi:hypothetical protein